MLLPIIAVAVVALVLARGTHTELVSPLVELKGANGGKLTTQMILRGRDGADYHMYFFDDGSRRIITPRADFYIASRKPGAPVSRVAKGTPADVQHALDNLPE